MYLPIAFIMTSFFRYYEILQKKEVQKFHIVFLLIKNIILFVLEMVYSCDFSINFSSASKKNVSTHGRISFIHDIQKLFT